VSFSARSRREGEADRTGKSPPIPRKPARRKSRRDECINRNPRTVGWTRGMHYYTSSGPPGSHIYLTVLALIRKVIV